LSDHLIAVVEEPEMPMSLLEAAAAAKHDLGKYVAFQARWLPANASDQEWLEALQADVLHTRRSSDASQDAPSLWERLRGPLIPLQGDSDLAAVDAAIAELQVILPRLAQGDLSSAELVRCSENARAVATHLAALHRRLRQGAQGG
jgi:hypothetical protein